MADPELPAPKPKRKRGTPTFVNPEEMAEMILDELEKSREGIDKKLTKYNDSILQAQIKKRQLFVDYCESEIGGLPKRLRSSLATRLLSSEDLAVKMNFSELHTSSAKSHLTWSCGDASLSDPSWRKLLEQYAGGAAEASSTRTRELGKRSQATRKGSSPPIRASVPIAKAAGTSTSDTQAEDDEDPFAVPEDLDPLSIERVTISKTRSKTNTGPQVPPPSHEAGPRKGPQGPFSQAKSSKKRSSRWWTEDELNTLRALCSGKPEARSYVMSPFWENVQAQMLPRSAAGCWSKWSEIRGTYQSRKRWVLGDDAPHRTRKRWLAEDLTKLEQLRPRDGKSIDWNHATALFPERTLSSVASKCNKYFGGWYEYRDRGTGRAKDFVGAQGTVADESSGQSKGDVATREDEDGPETGSDEEIP